MNFIILFLTILFPVLNYYIYSIFFDKSEKWKKRSKQQENIFIKIFKIVEKSALSLCIFYALYSNLFILEKEISIIMIALGSIISTCGLVLLFYSRKEIGDNFSPCHTAHLPEKYIATGPYKFFKHPIYLANILTLIGIVVINWSVIMVIALIFLFIFYLFAMYGETRSLKENFPDSFSGKFVPRRLTTESEFKEFTERYKESCLKRKLILNFEPNQKEFQICDNVIGIYRDNELCAGYVINDFPMRSLQNITEKEQEKIIENIKGSICEIVSIWHTPSVTRLEFGLQIWPLIVWDTVSQNREYIFGCSMNGHGLKGLYTFFGPRIVVHGERDDDLVAFYFGRKKFVFTFIAAFLITIPKAIKTKLIGK